MIEIPASQLADFHSRTIRLPVSGQPDAPDAQYVLNVTDRDFSIGNSETENTINMLENYFPILLLLAVALGTAVLMIGGSYLVGARRPYAEKCAQYECGFAPLSRVRMPFDVRFYLISILFVVFDIEAAFMFPWAVAFKEIGIVGFIEMVLFLLVLLVGYAYVWKKGALEWE